MSVQTRTIHQNFLDEDQPPIGTMTLLESTVTEELVQEFLATSASSPPLPIRLGLSPAYSPSSNLIALAISTTSRVVIIQFHNKTKAESAKIGRQIIQTKILSNPECQLFAFNVGPLATSLFHDHGLRMVNGVDIQSACSGASDSTPLSAIKFAVGDNIPVHGENIEAAFEDSLWDPARTTSLALQAWISSFLPSIRDMEERFNNVKRVNTQDLDETYLAMIAQMARNDQQLASKKPSATTHEFNSPLAHHEKLNVKSSHFQNRIQRSSNMRLMVQDQSGAQFEIHGRTVDISGPSATLRAESSLQGKTITQLVSTGSERPTNAEREKALAILQALQGQSNLFKNPFLQYMLSPSADFSWPEDFVSSDTVPSVASTRLNDSQHHAVEHMLSINNSTRITMIHGPPGTGKTSVIAAYVCSAVAAAQSGIWLVAQKNVAVKNIAEKLADVGCTNWKILVSADFHLGWHEHLYQKINKNIIRSDEFQKAPGQLQDCPVVLCTLSMLSNPRVKTFTRIVPLTTLVVDEASQIAIQDYIPPLTLYSTIRKMCFIGDDKQLPPYGQDDIEDLRSVFEVSHLREAALLLDTQYRMPPHIGDFISTEVYEGQLASNPLHPVKDSLTFFIDVDGGCEKRSQTSWTNPLECEAVLKIAAKLENDNKNYRIITPYVAQKDLLEKEMKEHGLRWANKCFVIDSFQGNEDDYIIISLVRSKDLGFLTDLRRTNVMLTRCKRGMYICTSWNFIWSVAQDTLVGHMAVDMGEDAWRGGADLDSGDF